MAKRRRKSIDEIAKKVARIRKAVRSYHKEINKEKVSIESQILKNVDYLPSSYDIMELYGIHCESKDLNEEELSYFDRKKLTIYISKKYWNDSYAKKHLLAHELGHFILHDSLYADMNNYRRKTDEEYEANVFSILLMPQIMAGENWECLTPEELNTKVYNKVFRKDK